MTCNNIILAKPEAGASVPYSLPAGESARLSFDAGEISGLDMNADGGLVIRFVQGGELTLTNFQDLVDGGNLLYLSDGTLIDPAVLQASLASSIAPAAGEDAVVIGIPGANEVKEYTVEAGKDYLLDFDIDTPVSAGKRDGDFVMTFANGGMVVMRGYEGAMASADAPSITSTSKVCVYEGEELITNIQTLAEAPVAVEEEIVEEEIATPVKQIQQVAVEPQAEDVALIEPAAGESSAEQVAAIEPAAGEAGALNSGYGFNSRPGSEPLGSIDDVGPINPTALQYGVDFQQEENIILLNSIPTALVSPVGGVDETDLATGNPFVGGSVNVNWGGDGAGIIAPNDTFSSAGSRLNDALTSGGVPVTVTQTASGYEGHAGGTLIFGFVINPTTGAFRFTLYGPLDHADPDDDNDIIELYFGISATDSDGDTVSVNVRIDVLDDVPHIQSSGGAVDETDLAGGNPTSVSGTVTFSAGQDIPPSAFGPTGDDPVVGGSMLNPAQLTSGNVPVTITYAGGTYTGMAGGTQIFTMVFTGNGDYTFTLYAPLDHGDPNDPNDIITIDFPVAATDYDGDTATGSVRIQILDDAPVIGDSRGDVDETNFVHGNLVYTSTVPNTFGQDIASIEGTGVFNPVGLTSNGVPVNVTYTGGTYVGTAGSTTVFTLEIDPNTGAYTYTQFANLDHPIAGDNTAGEHNDIISLEFEVRLINIEGQIDIGTITIDVADDGPVARNDYSAAEEGQLITGNVVANDDISTDAPNHVVNVNFNGTDYPIAEGGSETITGLFGTLTINSDGTWSYLANEDVPDNVTNLDSFTYTLRDRDGDTSTAVLQITVTDEGTSTEYPVNPGIGDDVVAVDETSLATGPAVLDGSVEVISNGETIVSVTGIDGSFTPGGSMAGGVLTSNGVPVTVTFDAATNTYTGMAGGNTVFTLQLIGLDGDYRFTLMETLDHADGTDPNDIIRLDFGIRVEDSDGDTADGTITIRVYDDAPVAMDDGTVVVQDNQTVTGNVTDNDIESQDGPTLVVSVNGVTIPASGDVTITGTYGTLTINSTGAYSYTAFNNNVAGMVDEFTYVLEDFDGDRDTATFSFTTEPDAAPVIVDGADQVDETNLSGGTIVRNGTVTVNSSSGDPADIGPVTVTGNNTFSSGGSQLGGNLTHQGQPVNVTFNAGTNTYTGATAGGVTVFTMQFQANGNYTFRLLSTLDHADGNDPNDAITLNFGVRATENDGDFANGTVTVTVFDDAPEIGNGSGAVDESSSAPLVATGTVPHSFGADGTGEIRGTGSFTATDSVTPGGLRSGGQLVDVQWDAATNSYVATINGGATTVFTLHINPVNGEFTYTQFRTLDHADPNDPSDNIRLTFGIEIEDYDGDTDLGVITIDVVDDGPSIIVNATNLADETNLATGAITRNGNITVSFSGDGTGTIEGNGNFDSTGSKLNGNLTHMGHPVNVAFNAVTNTYTGTANGTTIFTMVINANGSYTFRLFENLDHADGSNPNDEIDLVFGVTAVPNAGTAGSVNGMVTITIRDDAPIARDDNGGTTSGTNPVRTGNVMSNDTAGQDGPTYVTSVSIGGQTYTVPANGNNVSIETANGTLVINRTGAWTYTANNRANGTDVFTYRLRDFDGDTDTATLTVTARDGVPVITATGNTVVDETNLATGTIVQTGTVSVNYGSDGAGSVTGNGSFSSGGSRTGGTLTHNGVPVNVTFNASNNTYTGVAGGVTVFTMQINANGNYTFRLLENLDHANGSNPNDEITLTFGIRASDADGDAVTGNVTVTVRDDAPIARDDNGGTTSGLHPVRWGNVMSNDDVGADGPGTVTQVTINGTTVNVPTDGSNVTINGAYGVLIMNSVGGWRYTANNLANGTDVFTYRLRDFDGDTDTATLTVTARDGVPVITATGNTVVDETNLATGTIVQTGTVSVNYGSDGAGSVTGNGSFSSGGSRTGGTLTHNGVPVNVTFNASNNTYTGVAGGVTVFTMQINANGNYTFRLLENLDHANGSNPNDEITLTFGIRASDADGDSVTGNVTVTVRDDAPDAVNDNGGTTSGTNPVRTGNVMTNDTVGADGPGTITQITFNGSTVNIPANGNNVTINGTYGVLTINNSGAWTYTANNRANGTDVFTYRLRDFDGDTDTATLTVTARDGVPTITSVTGNDLVDETNLASGTLTATGKVNVNYGSDGAGTITGNGTFSSSGSQLGGVLRSEGTNIIVTHSNGVYTGRAGNITVFTMTIATNGDYTFRQFKAIDHADGSNPNDIINLNFGVRVTDADGDAANGTVTVRVRDDAPIARDDNGGTTSGTNPVRTGNVMSNDTAGQDGPTYVTSVSIGGQTYTVPANGNNVSIETAHGTLVINRTGAWTYTAKNLANGTDVFNYTIRDFDGDTSSANLTVTARDGVPIARDDFCHMVLEGTTTPSAWAIVDLFWNDTMSPDGGTHVVNLTRDGVTYLPGNTYTIPGQGTLEVYTDGTIKFTRALNNLSGSDLVFNYTIRDVDGDTSTATVTFRLPSVVTPTPWTVPETREPPGDGDGGNVCPLIIDLTGMGINLTSRADGVTFDMDLDGVADWTAWAGVGSGFLVLDRNGDGVINDRSEMFGDTDGFTDGFDNLASYDSNGDGIIDANDDIWSQLLVWHDLNQDGISDANELLTLEQIGIVGIRLNAELPEGLYIEGNWISHVSTVIMADGTERAIVDAWFSYDRGYNDIEAGGTESVYGTDGADSFLFAAIGEAATTVHNFNASEGDRLDLSSVLQGQDDVSDAINDFVYARRDGDDLVISVDVSGSGDVSNAHDIARLDGMADLDLDSLLQNGNIVV